jgi:hypothetical protein
MEENSASNACTAQPVTIISAPGFAAAACLAAFLVSRTARAVTAQLFIIIARQLAGSFWYTQPASSRASIRDWVSYWFILQPRVMVENLFVSGGIF